MEKEDYLDEQIMRTAHNLHELYDAHRYIRPFGGRPERVRPIDGDDIANLLILLSTEDDFEFFLAKA